MILRTADISCFRNIKEAHLTFSSQLTLLVGKNAQGKTNALEAIHIALQGKSFRNAPDSDWFSLTHPEGISLVAKVLSGSDRMTTVEHHVTLSPHRRSHRGPKIPVIVFSPQDLSLSQGSPSDRRKFMDATLSLINPRYEKVLKQFQHAVLQRNHALKDPRLAHTADSFTPSMITSGLYLWTIRRQLLEELLPMADRIHGRIGHGERIGGTLKYGGCDVPVKTEKEYEDCLRRRRADEGLRMMTLVGPHRDELLLTVNDFPISLYGSQGQHRLISLSLKLATYHLIQNEFGFRPIMLLDDVLSELDPDRRHALLQMISEPGQQTIITDTEARNYDQLTPIIYHVDQGQIVKVGGV
jgi:DNA replication and repair protein RecF